MVHSSPEQVCMKAQARKRACCMLPGQISNHVFAAENERATRTLAPPGSTLFQGGQTWGQQYVQKVQQRMSWLSGGPLSFHFNVSN
eukprot:356316-Chlamydomonas_euryale.AAC.5